MQSWIVCDGDIDPEWIESLNSVLDDNRLLTMPSGERIQFGPNVNFLFETHDLSCASPATISRMGMIFLRCACALATHVCVIDLFACIYCTCSLLTEGEDNDCLSFLCVRVFSDEDTDVKALVTSWLKRQDEKSRELLSGWIEDHFYSALELVLRGVSAR